MTTTRHYFQGWIIVAWSTLAITIMVASILFLYGADQESLLVLIRATARTSFILFITTFLASPLSALWPTRLTHWMRWNRRYLGVSFAASHTFHAMGIIGVAILTSGSSIESSDKFQFVGGLVAYIFIAAMVATSFDRTAAWVGRRRWLVLHTTGIYYNWIVFMFSYGERAIYSLYYIPPAALLIFAITLRVVAARKPKRVAAAKGA